MTLDELIARLERADPEKVLPIGFHNPHSYRGDYSQLAFEPAANVKVADMLSDARRALGATYEGWKGGDYKMDGYVDVHLNYEGDSGDGELTTLLLEYMLGETPELPKERRG